MLGMQGTQPLGMCEKKHVVLIVICPVSPGSWLQIQADSGGAGKEAGGNPEATMKLSRARLGPAPLRNSELHEICSPTPAELGPSFGYLSLKDTPRIRGKVSVINPLLTAQKYNLLLKIERNLRLTAPFPPPGLEPTARSRPGLPPSAADQLSPARHLGLLAKYSNGSLSPGLKYKSPSTAEQVPQNRLPARLSQASALPPPRCPRLASRLQAPSCFCDLKCTLPFFSTVPPASPLSFLLPRSPCTGPRALHSQLVTDPCLAAAPQGPSLGISRPGAAALSGTSQAFIQ